MKSSALSGNMADDELTEDPYAEQNFQMRKSTRKYRSPHDKLPTPAESTPVTLPSPPHFRPRLVTPPHPMRWPTGTTSDSESDSLSDYEKIDDDQPKASWSDHHVSPIRTQSDRRFDQPLQPAVSGGQGFRRPEGLLRSNVRMPPSPVRLPELPKIDPHKSQPAKTVGIVQPSTVHLPEPSRGPNEVIDDLPRSHKVPSDGNF